MKVSRILSKGMIIQVQKHGGKKEKKRKEAKWRMLTIRFEI